MDYMKENEIDTNEKELTRLWNMGYEMDKIFEDEFLEKFHEIKNELELIIRKELELWKSRKEKKPEVDEEIKELNTLYEVITDQDYEIEKVNIKRLLSLEFDRYELLLDGIMRQYLENKEKNNEDIQRILMQLMETKGYGRVSDKKFDESDEFNETDESNRSDESEELENTKMFEEIIRTDLKKLGYDVKIAEIERIRKFGIPAGKITTYEFMKKYLTIWNLENKEVDKLIL
ncbi:hypothetical protein C1646_673928 [Rhizophagus diaphanus]|nr:hypothetical protein C1646_673928 [Rhizophagus diaphanus] [Rhizophagus sp. MUCL 43196]